MDRGALPQGSDIESLGFLLASTAHSIGIRARAGQTRQDMEKRVDALARLICPTAFQR